MALAKLSEQRYLAFMSAESYFEACVSSLLPATDLRGRKFSAWKFGGSNPNALLDLVLASTKTATASLAWIYEHFADEKMPVLGDLSVILDDQGDPQALIKTSQVETVPFSEVTAEHAFLEGEGDRSLEHWRKVHWDFFSTECASIDREPTGEMPIILERFRLLSANGGQR